MAPTVEPLTFALPKGRILKQALPLFERAGFCFASALGSGDSRELQFTTTAGHRLLLVKPVDVATYVEYGIADIGIAGLDSLEEDPRDLYRPLDLRLGACRLAIAEPVSRPVVMRPGIRVRVATKYPHLAQRHYRARGIQPEIIKLFGSVELGPITGLSDQIVDLVESGETLRQNNLREVETILEVSSRLIVHPASLKLKRVAIRSTIHAIAEAMKPASTGSP
ncbi:MAG: ATP phosphoribosyltransferase [Nannocystaceae bacterium]